MKNKEYCMKEGNYWTFGEMAAMKGLPMIRAELRENSTALDIVNEV
jgi:hypothetical protein